MKIKNNYHNILVIFPALFIMLFAYLVMFPVVPESTHAEGDEPEDGISVIASSDISINLLSKDEGYYKIFKDTITVSTSSENGYTLSIATDSADHQTLYLNGDTSSENGIYGAIGTYEQPEALGDYEWGFAVPGISYFDDIYSATEPSEESKFAIIPLENKIICDYTEAVTDNVTDIYYGFKLSGALELGEYETVITYTAISADQPPTVKAVLGDNGNLNFLYNRKAYTPGETYIDNIGETEIVEVYDDIPADTWYDVMEDFGSCPAWIWSNTIYSANFDRSFYNFEPTDTACWFLGLTELSFVTNVDNLNTDNVVDMSTMFYYAGENAATIWSIDNLSSWNTSNVADMSYMFYRAGFSATTWDIGDLSTWNTSNVTNVAEMFNSAGYKATTFILDLGGWNTSNMTTMSGMFAGAGYSATTWGIGDIGDWDVSYVEDMSYMFSSAGRSAPTFVLNLSDWDVGSVTSMTAMLAGAGENASTWSIGDLSGWDTCNVTSMYAMFYYAGYSAASNWSIGNLGYVDEDHIGWDTRNVTDMFRMFECAGYTADTWSVGDLSSWDTGNVTRMSYMFYGAGYNAAAWDIGDIHDWNVSSVSRYFHDNFVDESQSNIVDKTKLPW